MVEKKEKSTSNETVLDKEELRVKTINDVQDLRVRVDGLKYILVNLYSERIEVMRAIEHLTAVRGWLKEVLLYLGVSNENKSVLHKVEDIISDTDLSPTIKVIVTDTDVKTGKKVSRDGNTIESIDHVRLDMNYIANVISSFDLINTTIFNQYLFQHLRECKFWLDEYLYSVKNKEKMNKLNKPKLPKRPEKKIIPLGNAPLIANHKAKRK